jgi:mannose-1-phosphate guanylyltransferase
LKRLAVIMAGGAGERFWPVSRLSRPKQLLRLGRPDRSLLEEAVERAVPLVGKESIFISTGRAVEQPIRSSGAVPEENVLVEPDKRNTLGALCWVAAKMLAAHPDEDLSLAVLTADHRIHPAEAFRECVETALDIAEREDALVTIGIRPDRPETGYGYIEVEKGLVEGRGVYRVLSFREKPDLPTAKTFLEEGNYLWNSGMFFWTLRSFMRELEGAQPDAHRLTLGIVEALRAGNAEAAEREFSQLPNISVDFALMEKAKKVMVVASNFEWDDVGAWDALERTFATDASRNVAFGDAVLLDAQGCVVYNDSEAFVSLMGVEDLLVVATADAFMVCRKGDAQRVREIVARLKETRPELT